MTRYSTPATRAARRLFWTSPALVATGRILDRLRASQRFLRPIVAGMAVALAVVLGSVNSFPTPLDTPCQTEDSTWCYWDSTAHGNGQGVSFIAFTEEFKLETK